MRWYRKTAFAKDRLMELEKHPVTRQHCRAGSRVLRILPSATM